MVQIKRINMSYVYLSMKKIFAQKIQNFTWSLFIITIFLLYFYNLIISF